MSKPKATAPATTNTLEVILARSLSDTRKIDIATMRADLSVLDKSVNRTSFAIATIIKAFRLNNPKASGKCIAKALHLNESDITMHSRAYDLFTTCSKFKNCTPDDYRFSVLYLMADKKGALKEEFKNIRNLKTISKSKAQEIVKGEDGATADSNGNATVDNGTTAETITKTAVIDGIEYTVTYTTADINNGVISNATLTPVEK